MKQNPRFPGLKSSRIQDRRPQKPPIKLPLPASTAKSWCFRKCPLGWWAGLTLAFAVLYAVLATGKDWGWLDPFYLSVRHGLVVGGLVRTGHMQDVITQMFYKPGSGLALLMMFQTVLSAFFLFLFFLALRNHFRIR